MKANKYKGSFLSICLVSVILFSSIVTTVSAVTFEDLETQKVTAHRIANEARTLGLTENHNIIQEAKNLWLDAHSKIEQGSFESKVFPSVQYYTEQDVSMLAKLMFGEGRGIPSKTQLACIVWTVLNRVDAGYGSISKVVTAKNQYHYSSSFSTTSDYGFDLKGLARDVLERWNLEKNGVPSSGRVLPSTYLYFHGTGSVNKFRNNYSHSKSTYWNYSLTSPYEN